MPVRTWQPGDPVASPAYLDAGFLAAALIRKDARYANASRLLAELLVNQTELVVSLLTLTEALWAVVKLSYCEMMKQPPGAHFNPEIFRRHHANLVARYGDRFDLIGDLIRDLLVAGVPVSLAPTDMANFQEMAMGVGDHMRSLGFASADAAHLALAQANARSLITTDTEFRKVADEPLDILLIQA
jgi:predicted nucleic acid-binding protein